MLLVHIESNFESEQLLHLASLKSGVLEVGSYSDRRPSEVGSQTGEPQAAVVERQHSWDSSARSCFAWDGQVLVVD